MAHNYKNNKLIEDYNVLRVLLLAGIEIGNKEGLYRLGSVLTNSFAYNHRVDFMILFSCDTVLDSIAFITCYSDSVH